MQVPIATQSVPRLIPVRYAFFFTVGEKDTLKANGLRWKETRLDQDDLPERHREQSV